MQKLLVVGNWKANPETLKSALAYIAYFSKKKESKHKPFFLAVPLPYIASLCIKKSKSITVGAQAISSLESGAYTGGVTASMVKSAGAEFVIVGHSEVRALGITDERVSEEVRAVLASGLTAIICVGESKRDEKGTYLSIIEAQIISALDGVDAISFGHIVIAYEPLWAVNGGAPATEAECFEVAIMIRRTIATLVGIDHAKKVRVVYGGSVDIASARGFIENGGVDGLLVGRVSWKPETFSRLVLAAYGGTQ